MDFGTIKKCKTNQTTTPEKKSKINYRNPFKKGHPSVFIEKFQ